ncbi:hypothetical protein BABINDRAFT_176389 [Babjeviella inositovora NRRL Y-12698]|uniref:C2 NT-type domain-containing protein n=1 Tax=Babjeviella inositovora NRRL Y-12698 TaxID=984486 RepID=A0A1E3QRB1_9ASCO|nr:uncharacterized protein BABINDRAFT_176389 [Babjeviella inositovora NRRL Y-12698]ODQ79487.1 hypothetical protein BABINDRAFT_176389 [Babjeviella inositovora NRRL Y-12698]
MSLLSSSKKNVKYNVSLSFQELTNVPQPVGSCVIKYFASSSATNDLKALKNKPTPPCKILNFKCRINYETKFRSTLAINAKSGKLAKEKKLVLLMYYSTTEGDATVQALGRLKLEYMGRVEINLSEFLHDHANQAETHRYLLQDAKVNSILTLKLGLTPVDVSNSLIGLSPSRTSTSNSSFVSTNTASDNDSALGLHSSSSGLLPDKRTLRTSQSYGSVPPSPLLEVTSDSGSASRQLTSKPHALKHALSQSSSPTASSINESDSRASLDSARKGIFIASAKPLIHHKTQSPNADVVKPLIIDPIINKFYNKICDISWDQRQGEFSPQECVDDIFNGGTGWAKNEDGVYLIDQRQAASDYANELENEDHLPWLVGSTTGDDTKEFAGGYKYRDNGKTGLVYEEGVRLDMRSWTINSVS